MSRTQTETFTNTQFGKEAFERFAKLRRGDVLLDTQINVSQVNSLYSYIKMRRSGMAKVCGCIVLCWPFTLMASKTY